MKLKLKILFLLSLAPLFAQALLEAANADIPGLFFLDKVNILFILSGIISGVALLATSKINSNTRTGTTKQSAKKSSKNTLFLKKHKPSLLFNSLFAGIIFIFAAIKFGIPAIYTGSFVDEYYHILSGIEFFQTGHFAEIYHGNYYQRGAHTSFLVGVFMFLFGQTIFVAKMLPALLGIINFFLLYKIGKHFFANKFYILLLLSIFTATPWFLFNHFYIRTYVLYEFFMLFLTLLFILITKNIQNTRKLSLYSLAAALSLLTIFLFSNDSSMYPVLLYASLLITYLFFFQIQKIPFKKPLWQKLSRNQKLKAGIFTLFSILAIFQANAIPKIAKLFSGSIPYSSSPDLRYENLFFNFNLSFAILFLSSIALVFQKKISPIIKTVILASLFIFLLYYTSSSEMQITRGIIYFLPFFYLIAVFSLSQISKIYTSKIPLSLIIIFFAANIWQSYPDKFLSQGPHLPSEVDYLDYKKAYNYISDKTDSEIVIVDSSPHTSQFYTSQKVSVLITKKEKLFIKDRIFSNPEKENSYLFPYGKIPLIENYKANKENLQNKYILIRKPIMNAYLDQETLKNIQKDREKMEFANIDVYKPAEANQ